MSGNKFHARQANRGIILEITPRSQNFDLSQVAVDIANGKPVDLSGFDVHYHTDIVASFAPEFFAYIVEHGLTSLLRRQSLLEALVAPGTSITVAQTLLHGFLGALAVTTDLVIVDPYFFASTDSNYPQVVEQILQPVLSGLRNLTIVTNSGAKPTAVSEVTRLLKASEPQLSLVHKISGTFHDRFWINPVSATGFVTGTSLNGLGKKYALVDRLQPSDVADVVAALKGEGLL